MLFGKHKGKEVSEVPRKYLEWVEANIPIRSKELAEEIATTLHGMQRQQEMETDSFDAIAKAITAKEAIRRRLVKEAELKSKAP